MFPTALLPCQYICWEPIDTNSATAVTTNDDNSGKIRFCFNDVGEIVKDESSDRYDRIDGTFQEVGSIGYRNDYKKIDGIKVPMKFTIMMVLPNGIHEEFW